MKTATSITLLATGAIFTFAINAHTSFLNLHIVGVVVMATGVAGLLLSKRGQQGRLRRRVVVRKGPRGPVVGHVEETPYPPYVKVNPGAVPEQSDGHPEPGDLTVTNPDANATDQAAAGAASDLHTEVVEEYLQE